jgi:hypothetical protein
MTDGVRVKVYLREFSSVYPEKRPGRANRKALAEVSR